MRTPANPFRTAIDPHHPAIDPLRTASDPLRTAIDPFRAATVRERTRAATSMEQPPRHLPLPHGRGSENRTSENAPSRHRGSGRQRGQSLLEYVILLVGVITPMTFGLIAIAQMMWIWHSVVDYTRLGARYAATHCWQSGSENVLEWMRTNVPPMPDQASFRDGPAELIVEYYKKNVESGLLEPFQCDGECSTLCVPDTVTVRVRNYEFRFFMGYLGLPPVQIPDFSTSMPIEGAGCDPELGTCNP